MRVGRFYYSLMAAVVATSVQPAGAAFDTDKVAQPPLELTENLAKCAGQLNAARRYAGHVDGLEDTVERSENALDFMVSVTGGAFSSYQLRKQEYGSLFDRKLMENPMDARPLLRETVSDCARQISYAQVIHDNASKIAAAKAAATAEEARRSRLRFEAELAKSKAEAEAKVEAARAARIAAEYDGQARLESARQSREVAAQDAAIKLEQARGESLKAEAQIELAKFASKNAERDIEAAKLEVARMERPPALAPSTAQNVSSKASELSDEQVANLMCGGFLTALSGRPPEGLSTRQLEEKADAYFQLVPADDAQRRHVTAFMIKQAWQWTKQSDQEKNKNMAAFVLSCGLLEMVQSGDDSSYFGDSLNSSQEITLNDSDPVYGAACYTWAHVVRSWWDEKAYRSYMESQAKGALEYGQLYSILLATMDGVVNGSARTKQLVQSNGWNEYCVSKMTGRA